MNRMIPLLYLDSTGLNTHLVTSLLLQSSLPFDLHQARSEAEFIKLLPSQDWQIIIAHLHLGGFGGLEALKILKEQQSTIPVVLLSTHQGEHLAVRAIKAGAYDYFLTRELSRLLPCLSRILLEKRSFSASPPESLAQLSLQALVDAIVLINPDGSIKLMNEAAQRLSGWRQEQAQGRPLAEILPLKEENSGTSLNYPGLACLENEQPLLLANNASITTKQGKNLLIEGSIAPIRNLRGYILGLVLTFRDVTEARRLTHQLTFEASHDSLTGLVNRREFEHRLERFITKVSPQQPGALLFMDLDHFKIINDTSGHLAGDEVLRQITRLLHSLVRDRDTLGRLGGDEFALLIEGCSLEQACRIAETILQQLQSYHFVWQRQVFHLGISIGIVPLERASQNSAKLLDLADHACYIAKDSGRNHYLVYQEQDPELLQQQHDHDWHEALQQALDQGSFQLFRQRIQSRSNSSQQYFEMLLRYPNPQGNLISPAVFLATAERHRLLPAIDQWVVKQSLDWLKQHPNDLAENAFCSINLSGASLKSDQAIEQLIECLTQSPINPAKICFEVSEQATLNNFDQTRQQMLRLKQLGCHFALDNFGLGLASCSYLHHLPIDLLKIDGSFIESMLYNQSDFLLVKAINEVSHILGKQTVAEYVSSERLQDKVCELGVDFLQGYHISRPEALKMP